MSTFCFINFWQSYGSWLMSKSCFCSVSWEWIDRSWSSFVYALILTRCRDVWFILHILFCCFLAQQQKWAQWRCIMHCLSCFYYIQRKEVISPLVDTFYSRDDVGLDIKVAMSYRKTGNFRVVQFLQNFAVSINLRKLKSAKYFPIFEKLVFGN